MSQISFVFWNPGIFLINLNDFKIFSDFILHPSSAHMNKRAHRGNYRLAFFFFARDGPVFHVEGCSFGTLVQLGIWNTSVRASPCVCAYTRSGKKECFRTYSKKRTFHIKLFRIFQEGFQRLVFPVYECSRRANNLLSVSLRVAVSNSMPTWTSVSTSTTLKNSWNRCVSNSHNKAPSQFDSAFFWAKIYETIFTS